jgi:hypothetical protein
MENQSDFEYFPTPSWLVEYLHGRLELKVGDCCLDPFAGKGNLLPRIEVVKQFAFEVDPEYLSALNDVTILGLNFFQFKPQAVMNVVVMNPPFSLQINAYRLAFDWLSRGGRLVGLASRSPWDYPNSVRHRAFLAWLKEKRASIQELPFGCFLNAEIPTSVEIVLIQINK